MEQQHGRTSLPKLLKSVQKLSVFKYQNSRFKKVAEILFATNELLLAMVGILDDPPTLWTCIIWCADDGWAVRCPEEPCSIANHFLASPSRLPWELRLPGSDGSTEPMVAEEEDLQPFSQGANPRGFSPLLTRLGKSLVRGRKKSLELYNLVFCSESPTNRYKLSFALVLLNRGQVPLGIGPPSVTLHN